MIAYAESSAVLAWLLGESRHEEVRALLASSERSVSSTLTPVECARVLARGVASGRLSRGDELGALRLLDVASERWFQIEMTGPVLDRARGRFPVEPLRTLDALHLASAVVFAESAGPLTLVSLDDRIRENAKALRIEIAP